MSVLLVARGNCRLGTVRRDADGNIVEQTAAKFEPVLDPETVLACIYGCAHIIDKAKIGKLNYHPSEIDWAQFGRNAEIVCREMDLDYYIKDSLRTEMDKP